MTSSYASSPSLTDDPFINAPTLVHNAHAHALNALNHALDHAGAPDALALAPAMPTPPDALTTPSSLTLMSAPSISIPLTQDVRGIHTSSLARPLAE